MDYGQLPVTEYILKQWNTEAIEVRKSELGCDTHADAVADLTRRSLQCQMVTKALAEAMAATVNFSYGETLRYITSYLLETKDGIVSLEPKIDGKFVKYFNNTMVIVLNDDTGLKAASLAYFSFSYTNGKSLIADLQGTGHSLTDPEIATMTRVDVVACSVIKFCIAATMTFSLPRSLLVLEGGTIFLE